MNIGLRRNNSVVTIAISSKLDSSDEWVIQAIYREWMISILKWWIVLIALACAYPDGCYLVWLLLVEIEYEENEGDQYYLLISTGEVATIRIS